MKTDILLHIPMNYGAYWCMTSQKPQHNYCDLSFSAIAYYIKLKMTNMVYFVFLKFVICLHQDIKMFGKLYLWSYRAIYNFHKRIWPHIGKTSISMISIQYFDGTSTSRLQI